MSEAEPPATLLPEASNEAVDILLVEDNPNDVQLTLHALNRYRLTNRVRVVRDGAEALAFPHAQGAEGPKVVFLDLKLPRVDGIEVLRAIRGDPRTRTIPVVILTSSREERDIAQTYALGANSYIVQPGDFDQFTEAVRQLGLYWVVLNQRSPGAAP